MKLLQMETQWSDEPILVSLGIHNYQNNGRLALELIEHLADPEYGQCEEPYGMVTVNIPDEEVTDNDCGFVDVNNLGKGITEFLKKNGLAHPTGMTGFSGYCAYPEFEFDIDRIKEYDARYQAKREYALRGC